MFKAIHLRATIVFLILVSLVSIYRIYNGWAPLVSWLSLVLALVVMLALFLHRRVVIASKMNSSSLSSVGQGDVVPVSSISNSEFERGFRENDENVTRSLPRLPAGFMNIMPTIRPGTIANNVRAYASVEDAKSYGWGFSDEIGRFGGFPILQWAILDDVRWEYDGLTSDAFNPSVPPDRRVFGRLRYRQISPPSDPSSEPSAQVDGRTESVMPPIEKAQSSDSALA